MKKEYLEAGKIVTTHGIRGEVKIMPYTDSPDLLAEFDRQISLPWEDTLAEYRSRSYLTGREVALSDGQKALVTGISPDGGLTVKLPTGQTLSISSQFSVRELS